MKTEREKIVGMAAVWALPRTDWEIEQSENGRAFKYCIKTDTAWQDGAVKVCEFDAEAWIPEGLDLVAKAIETMQEKINKIEANAKKEVEDLMSQIASLQLIELQP